MPQGLKKRHHRPTAVSTPPPPAKGLRVVAGTALHSADAPTAGEILTRPPRLYTHAWFDLACFLVLATMLTLALVL